MWVVGKWTYFVWREGLGGYPEAACNPNPLLPPVTTTTFPFREKILGKSLSSVSYLDIFGGVRSGV